MYFLVADIKMDGLNMRCADGTATIAFETAGVMQDCEARWSSVTQGGGNGNFVILLGGDQTPLDTMKTRCILLTVKT